MSESGIGSVGSGRNLELSRARLSRFRPAGPNLTRNSKLRKLSGHHTGFWWSKCVLEGQVTGPNRNRGPNLMDLTRRSPDFRFGPRNLTHKCTFRLPSTLYDPKFSADSEFRVRFGPAGQNRELPRSGPTEPWGLARDSDPRRPNRYQIRTRHRVLTCKTETWAPVGPTRRDKSPNG